MTNVSRIQKYVLFFGVLGIFACSKSLTVIGNEQLVLPETPYDYTAENPKVENHKATLGRVLFYDKQMSKNNSVSCASCHKQSAGFADNTSVSVGLENKKTERNTPAIQNLSVESFDSLLFTTNGNINFINMAPSFQPLFWDARESNLTTLMLQPVTNHIEMGITNVDDLVSKLNKIDYYKPLVQKAYGKNELSREDISEALANFNASIRTAKTVFDKVVNKELSPQDLKPNELLGMQLFTSEQYNCSGCHKSVMAGPMIASGGSAYGGDNTNGGAIDIASFSSNIGLDNAGADNGIGQVSGAASLNGSFRIPDLHNVALTAPYMHDGRFATLEEVIGHYSHNIIGSANLDSRLKNANGTPKQLNINETDKKALIAFLNTLTCKEVTTDVKFSNPFVVSK